MMRSTTTARTSSSMETTMRMSTKRSPAKNQKKRENDLYKIRSYFLNNIIRPSHSAALGQPTNMIDCIFTL